jgi:hypothetical protein
MTTRTRRFVAAGVALAAIVCALIWTVTLSQLLEVYAREYLNQKIPISQAGGGRPDAFQSSAHVYYAIIIGGLILAAGASAALLVLVADRSFRTRAWIYVAFLALVLPASLYNYTQDDIVLPYPVQAGLNLAVAFLSATIAFWYGGRRCDGYDARVIQGLTIALLVMGGVLVPVFATTLWALNQIGWFDRKELQQITYAHLTGTAAVASAVIAWLNHRRELRNAAPVPVSSTPAPAPPQVSTGARME